jgi:hypothetical protein
MTEAETVGDHRARVCSLARLGGAAISLGLVLGAVGWAWQLLERDTVGVPIIRAADGPMRIAPENPGGDRAKHQGLSVSHIAAGAAQKPPAAELRLAPRSAELASEDMPAVLAAYPAPIDATDLAVAEALGLDPKALMNANVPVESRPAPRPVVRKTRPLADDVHAGEAVQLGAFSEEHLAASEWINLVGRFPALREGTERRIQRVERGGRTFWRLRAGGFADLADARRVCAALAVGDVECVPVVRR